MRSVLNDRLWLRVVVRAFGVLLALYGLYFVWAMHFMAFKWGPTFAEFDGEPAPSTADKWLAFLPGAAFGVSAVAAGVSIFLLTRTPKSEASRS